MGSIKSSAKKQALSKHLRQNRRIPIFVMAKTGRKVTRNTKARNWMTKKLKLKVK